MGGEMLEPGVTLCAVPVLYLIGNVDNHAGREGDGRFAPLLIPTTAGDADKYLVCAVMDVPVVSAAWLKGDVGITGNSLHTL